MHVDDESAPIRKNQAVYIPPHSKQFVENTGDTPLEVLCIVDPAWRQQDEQVE
jgi:mannose-6-phosphate isomerase-like protein (cupin superfamily)